MSLPRVLSFVAAASAAIVGVAGLAVAGDSIPFRGSAEIQSQQVSGGPLGDAAAHVLTQYAGTGTHVGAFSLTLDASVSTQVEPGGGGTFAGCQSSFTAELTAADGCRLFGEGQGGFATDGSGWTGWTIWITGGTGRFEGASGSVVTTRSSGPFEIAGSVTSPGVSR